MSMDYLQIANDVQYRKVVGTFGHPSERLLFSDIVVKINRKDKPQERILVVTDRALYNLNKARKMKRRIGLGEIAGITASLLSDEFVIHVPSEYDYRISATRKAEAVECIASARQRLLGSPLPISDSGDTSLKTVTVTRVQAAPAAGAAAAAAASSSRRMTASGGAGSLVGPMQALGLRPSRPSGLSSVAEEQLQFEGDSEVATVIGPPPGGSDGPTSGRREASSDRLSLASGAAAARREASSDRLSLAAGAAARREASSDRLSLAAGAAARREASSDRLGGVPVADACYGPTATHSSGGLPGGIAYGSLALRSTQGGGSASPSPSPHHQQQQQQQPYQQQPYDRFPLTGPAAAATAAAGGAGARPPPPPPAGARPPQTQQQYAYPGGIGASGAHGPVALGPSEAALSASHDGYLHPPSAYQQHQPQYQQPSARAPPAHPGHNGASSAAAANSAASAAAYRPAFGGGGDLSGSALAHAYASHHPHPQLQSPSASGNSSSVGAQGAAGVGDRYRVPSDALYGLRDDYAGLGHHSHSYRAGGHHHLLQASVAPGADHTEAAPGSPYGRSPHDQPGTPGVGGSFGATGVGAGDDDDDDDEAELQAASAAYAASLASSHAHLPLQQQQHQQILASHGAPGSPVPGGSLMMYGGGTGGGGGLPHSSLTAYGSPHSPHLGSGGGVGGGDPSASFFQPASARGDALLSHQHSLHSVGAFSPGSPAAPLAVPAVTGWSRDETPVGLASFELLRVIGRGSYGKVLQVRKRDSGEVFAMKVLNKALVVRRNQVEHTQAERAILESIDHPFLIKLRYAFQSPAKLYLVLPYLRGGEVFYHLKQKKRLDLPLARFYIAEIVLGVGHLHAVGIVYRDIKPENVLLDTEGHIKLTDFGLSKVLARPSDTTRTFCGTPEYLAPEVVDGLAHDKGVDWWGIGILLWEFLTGLPPFYSSNLQTMYDLIRTAELAFPPEFTPETRDFIARLLQRDPSRRLGNTPGDGDVEAVKAHPFFAGLDWDDLYHRRVMPPWRPPIRGADAACDAGNFDGEFTSEAVLDSVVSHSALLAAAEAPRFDGFTYQAPSAMMMVAGGYGHGAH